MSSLAADLSSIEAFPLLLLLVKATAVIIAAGAASLLLHRSAAAVRYWCWFLGLCGMLAVAVLAMALPAWRVLPSRIGPSNLNRELATLSPAPNEAHTPPAPENRLSASTANRAQNSAPQERLARTRVQNASVSRSLIDQAATEIAAPSSHPANHFRISWPIALLGIWLLGAAIAFVPTVVANMRLRQIRRGCVRLCDEDWQSLLAFASRELGLRRPVELLRAPEKRMPMVWGIFYPKLLIGADASDWPRQRRRAVLLHELAHLRRHDCLTDLLGRLICCIYWFHPLAWIALSQMRKLRELACDDLVLSSGQEPTRYAQHLLHIAATTPMASLSVGIQMARGPQLESRLLAILDPRKRRRPITRGIALISAACALALATPLAMLRAADPPRPASNPIEQIEGDVTTFDGHPVKDAEVVLVEMRPVFQGREILANNTLTRTRTDNKGKFRLPNPPQEQVHRRRIILATAEGFATGRSFIETRDANIVYFDVPRQLRTDRPSIMLAPAANIIGTVVDQRGNPVVGAKVLQGAGIDPEITDAAGHFVLKNVPPSRYGVFADNDSVGIQHPDFIDFSMRPNDIIAGQDNPLRIVLERGVLVEGMLSDAETGKPLKQFVVELEPTEPLSNWRWSSYSDAQGHYQIRVPAGQIHLHPKPVAGLTSTDSNYYPVVDVRSVRVPEGASPMVIDFQFRHAQTISGKVVDVEAGALAQLSVEALAAGAEQRGNNVTRHYSRVNADGTFTMSQIKPGRYEVQVKRASSANLLLKQYVTVQAGQDVADLILKIPPNAAADDAVEVRGTVRYADGSPAPNAKLDLVADKVPDVYAPRIDQNTYASADGSFAFHSVRPEFKWTIWARDSSSLQGAALVVGDGPELSKPITLTLQKGMEFSGTVMNADGKGLGGYRVGIFEVVRTSTGELHRPRVVAMSDGMGHYTVKGFVAPSGATPIILNLEASPAVIRNRIPSTYSGFRNLDVRPEAKHDGFDFEVIDTGSSIQIRAKENK